jgi:hypothetical protein
VYSFSLRKLFTAAAVFMPRRIKTRAKTSEPPQAASKEASGWSFSGKIHTLLAGCKATGSALVGSD